MSEVLTPLTVFVDSRRSVSAGITLIDSMPLCVCKNIPIPRHKTFASEAGRGKSSIDWFYGFQVTSDRQ